MGPSLVETVVFRPAVWDVPGPVDVVATMSDGTVETLFRYYPDELQFAAEEFVGRTLAEVRTLHHGKDVDWLRS